MAFVHLHVHTDYSLLDGLGKIKDIVLKAKESGMTACAITDHGTGSGIVEFYDKCKEVGIKPILGCEVYEAPGSRFDKEVHTGEKNYFHLILLIKNETGYKNLCRLITRSNTEGFYYKPRIDFELLEQWHEGLICLSACVAGRVPQAILNNKDVEKEIMRYKNLFGEDYYLEIQNHGIKEEMIVAQELVKYSQKLGIKLVCTNDCHYVNKEDSEAHEWLLCIQTEKKIDDPDRMIYVGDYSVKTEAEMRELFPSIQEAFDNTMEVADKCQFEFHYGDYRMPRVIIPEEYGSDYFKYLTDEAWKGYEIRYPEGNSYREQAKDRLQYELDVIEQMGFAEYFIDTRKTILWSRSHNILVGPGRGSAAGSVLCYCLRITDIDPLLYNLLFERFLNPERISMPDIDVDYDYSYRSEIIESEAISNGKDHFAKIQTFGTMQAKGVVKDCARVAGYPVSTGTALAKMIPNELNITLTKAADVNSEIEEYIEANELEKLWEIALKLEGTKKSASTHACGHIPTPIPCEELFPNSVDKESGNLICQFSMTEAEHLGNLKKDLLMLRNLTVINVAHQEIKKRYDVEVPLWNEQILNDKKALDMISAGDTNGVFQLESEGMKDFMKKLKPDCFEDIIAGVALYRPGPMDFIPVYIKGKKEPSSIQYLTPELESILEPTYGVIVYQEQVMQIVQKLAGFSKGRADVVRKGMSKKIQKIIDEESAHFIYGDEKLNITGCVKNGISEDIARQITNQMVDFAKYAFNKSHAACYAAIAMQTAYLKANYPLEFMAGLLSSVMDNTSKLIIYLGECRKKGIPIEKPNLNYSEKTFSIKDNKLQYGLLAIKGIGEDVLSQLLEERECNGLYGDLTDTIDRNTSVGKGLYEKLIKAGAFDFSGNTRRSMVGFVPLYLDGIKKEAKKQIEGQISLFDFAEEETATTFKPTVPPTPEYNMTDLLNYEKEVTGTYISGHPLEKDEELLKKHVTVSNVDFILSEDGEVAVKEGQLVTIGGLIKKVRQIYTKKDKKPMAFVTVEDRDGIVVDIVVFPKIYQEVKGKLFEDAKIIVSGKASLGDEKNASVLANEIKLFSDFKKVVWLRFADVNDYNSKEKQYEAIYRKYPGEDDIMTYLDKEKGRRKIAMCIDSNSEDMLREMEELLGKDNIKIVEN